ncbi:hypothetical protein C8J56DRAFT_930381 [Mycena floridula]|nr:hypothetical protein C8J56DRAFT_930381 [Mycena floridula]
MYSGTNNPFLDNSAQSRYPDIAPDTSTQFTSWIQPGSGNQSSFYPQSSFQSPQAALQSPQFNPGYAQTQQMSPQSAQGFQPSSYFGQQLQAVTSPMSGSYSYLQQNPSSPPTNYNPVQQQLQNNPGYMAQFDPYGSLGQLDAQSPVQQMGPQSSISGITTSTTTSVVNGNLHPREYIRAHKQEIESWDSYAWKQLLGSFDALKDAWSAKKKELEAQVGQLQMQLQYGGGGYYGPQIQQEGARLQGLMKEAELNSDSVAASSFQIHEVFQSYRQSGDQASKRRVREASNAALQSLPDWPPVI